MKAIIPIGGRGTRMQPLTFSTNKHFIPIANKPLIYYPIQAVIEAGIKDILITYNPGQLEYAKPILGDGSKFGAKFTYVLQSKPIGLANIYQVCEKYLKGEKFLVHLGDNIFTKGIKKEVTLFEKGDFNGMVVMIKHKENYRMGVPYFDKNNNLVKYVEKPKNPPHKFAIPGLYFFDSKAFKVFKGKDKLKPSARGEYEMPDAYQWLIDRGYKIKVVKYLGKWLDPGKFDDWVLSNEYLLSIKRNFKVEGKVINSEISNNVEIGKGTIIRNSKIQGPVVISTDCVFQDAFIGPYTSISSECSIIKSKVSNSVLLNNASVFEVDKTIKNTIIGRGATVAGKKGRDVSLFIGDKSQVFF